MAIVTLGPAAGAVSMMTTMKTGDGISRLQTGGEEEEEEEAVVPAAGIVSIKQNSFRKISYQVNANKT